jgi:general stress protein 26
MDAKELHPAATLIDPQGHDVPPLPWKEAEARIDAARWYWLTTLHPSGRPHTRPVLAVWTGGALCTTSSHAAQKGRNLRRDPRCSVAIMADDMHIVVEGTASALESQPALDRVAEAYRSKYNWPVAGGRGRF